MTGFTGLGSLPGTDMPAALRMTFDLVPGLPYLPELPARGPWAAMIGRGLGLPDGLPAEYEAGEWRLSGAPGVDQRRARATWRDDLDQLEEAAQGYAGPLKIQVAGPWTLAASTGVAMTGRVLADPGARRDLAGAWAHGVAETLESLRRRLPDVSPVLQVDEPSLPAVLAGAIPTPGGFFRHAALDLPEVVGHLATVGVELSRRGLEVTTAVHCCAPGLPVAAMLRHGSDGAGFDAVSLDLSLLTHDDIDALSQAVESGRNLWLGILPTDNPATVPGVDDLRRRVLAFVETLGVDVAGHLLVTPSCGLASFAPKAASQAFRVLARVAAQVDEELGS